MSEPAFTPGPWGVEATDFNLWIGPMRPDGGKVERVVVGLDADPTYTEAYTVRRNADARLIAAAPWLYDAAEDSLEAFKLLIAGLSHDRNIVEMIKPHIVEIETALAKARGQ